jgi:predicted secreted Zn-dependent protease
VATGAYDHLEWVRATDDPDPAAECIEIAAGEGDLVHLRQSDDPANVVTTTQAKWDAFVLGVRAGEFDHFVQDA